MISCVTGTINRLSLLRRLVNSVRKSCGDLEYEIVIVDNNSTDGTREWLETQDNVVYLNIGEPRGSVAAFQLGYESCSPESEYVVTLNDDIAIEGDTITRAARYLDRHPEVGQVAFGHRYQNRDRANPNQSTTQKAFGYVYAQCGMTRKWLGDQVDWCGPEEGYTHYAWDTRLSMAIWELGYSVVPVDGCAVIDWEFDDETRKTFSAGMRNERGQHPDTLKFYSAWRDRLPPPVRWIPAPVADLAQRVVWLAKHGRCRVLRFKAMMAPADHMRTACIDAFAHWGPTKQVNQDAIVRNVGMSRFQDRAGDHIREWQPDFVMLQAQRPNNLLPATLERLRDEFPNTFFFNWDGDTHYPLIPFHFNIARAAHLQGVISPTMFPEYRANSADNVCYWPIGVEDEFIDVVRDPTNLTGPDVLFLGTLYGEGKFPDAITRRDAVVALHRHSRIKFGLYGFGWNRVGISCPQTSERFDKNPQLYASSKMALSVSQTSKLWGYSSDRLYNIVATGCPALVQRFVGMEEHGFVDGETCIAWASNGEMLDKASYYINHAVEREVIGAAGRAMLLARHTWRHRVDGLLTMLEGMYDYGAP